MPFTQVSQAPEVVERFEQVLNTEQAAPYFKYIPRLFNVWRAKVPCRLLESVICGGSALRP